MKDQTKSILAKFALLSATIIWGGAFVVVKNAIQSLPTYYILGMRSAIASVLLSIVFWKRFRKMDRRYLWQGAILGTLLFLAYAFQTKGLISTTPGKNAFLTSIYCVLVPFFYWIFSKIRPDRYNVIAAVLCVIGIGFVSLRGDNIGTGGALVSLGDTLTLICGIVYAFHIVAIARFAAGKDVILLTILQFIVFSALSWSMSFLLEKMPEVITVTDWTAMIYLGVFATAIALLLQSIGQKYTPASQAAIILSLEGVFGVVFSMLFYQEKMSLILFVGFAFIFISVIISETKMDVHPIAYLRGVYAKIIDKKASP